MKLKKDARPKETGTFFVAAAIAFHIACIAMPYYLSADISNLSVEDIDDNKSLNFTDKEVLKAMKALGYKSEYGLWKICFSFDVIEGFECCKDWNKDDIPGDWMKGAQAMAILGLIVMTVAGGMAVLSMVCPSQNPRNKTIPLGICIVCVLGGIFTLAGVVIIGTKNDYVPHTFDSKFQQQITPAVERVIADLYSLAFSFGFDIASMALMFLGGGFIALSTLQTTGDDTRLIQ